MFRQAAHSTRSRNCWHHHLHKCCCMVPTLHGGGWRAVSVVHLHNSTRSPPIRYTWPADPRARPPTHGPSTPTTRALTPVVVTWTAHTTSQRRALRETACCATGGADARPEPSESCTRTPHPYAPVATHPIHHQHAHLEPQCMYVGTGPQSLP
jgi:hypothetical protein